MKAFVYGISLFILALSSCFAEHVFTQPPEDFHPKMEVAGCFCEKEGKVLFLLRNSKKPQGNTWCLPGGKLQQAETPKQAVIREVREETGLRLKSKHLTYCKKLYVRFPEYDIILHLFRAKVKKTSVDLDLTESKAYCWASIKEALQLPLIAGADEYIQEGYNEE